jgi:octanoyl-[GcvH]:protein N-octanoyltransferase
VTWRSDRTEEDGVGPPGVVEPVGVGATEATELAIAHALLRRAAEGDIDEALRSYVPKGPVVVFGRRDTRLPGYRAAVAAARAAGFDTAVRAVGGRAVAYTEKAVVVDHVKAERQTPAGMDWRFREFGRRFTTLLRELGIDARIGPVPGEYCPGAQSVNARGEVKLVGTAQRVLPRAWLFSSLVVVGDRERVRAVLVDVHRHLDLPFNPDSVGAVDAENGAITPRLVLDGVLRAWSGDVRGATEVDGATMERAAVLLSDHQSRVTRIMMTSTRSSSDESRYGRGHQDMRSASTL